jgi:hypothetical protein
MTIEFINPLSLPVLGEKKEIGGYLQQRALPSALPKTAKPMTIFSF